MSVAVVLTCYNEGAYLPAALQSVLAQTAAAAIEEIVVVDDGSAAQTQAVLDGIEALDPRLRLIRGPGGWGVSRARNCGVAASRAPLLAFLDGDDLWRPQRLARQLQALEADPAVDLVYTGYEALPDGATQGRAIAVYDLSAYARPARRYFLHDPPAIPSSLLVRRRAFEAAGGFDDATRTFEDTEFYLRFLRVGRMKGVSGPLVVKRYRAGSLSARRPELMAHHAFIAFAAAAREPDLAPLVPRRLAERAARLGWVGYYAGDLGGARRLARLARALRPLNRRAAALSLLLAGGPPVRRLLDPWLGERGRLHGR